MIVKIYVLRDPVTNEIRYVGRTSKLRVSDRLLEHISKAKFHEKYKIRINQKIAWIKNLEKYGLKPIIEVIEEVEGWEYSHERERELIREYNKHCNLFNLEDKGPGPINHNVDEATKKKISDTLKKNYQDGMKNAGYEALRRPVYQFDLQGILIKKHDSVYQASIEMNVADTSIHLACRKPERFKSIAGFRWSFKGVIEGDYKNMQLTPVQVELHTGEIFIFDSLAECSRKLEIPRSSLTKVINRENKIYKGKYKFKLLK